MSFASVSCLIAFYETMRPRLSAWHRDAGTLRRFGLYVLGLAFTTMVTTFATAPFTVYHFNRFPLYSVIANAIAVPIAGFWVMPWAIAACLMMPFGIEKLALTPMSWGIEAISWVGHTVTSWPGAVIQVPSPSSLALVLISLGGLWLCIWLGRWRWWGLALIALGIANIAVTRPPDLLIASSTRSNATALISTPAPKARISPITCKLMRNRSATRAPITSEEAARVPQPNAAAIYRLASGCPVLRAIERATG